MSTLILLVAALLPVIFLLCYIWKQDKQLEPTSWLVKSVLWGIVIVIPIALLEGGIKSLLFGVGGQPTSLIDTTLMAFLMAALPEETFKLLAL